jgi:hypothetical protein
MLFFSSLFLFSSSSLKTPQLLRHIIFSKVSLLSLFLILDIIRAPWEKNLLELAKEAGIPKYFLAIKDKTGYLEALSL